jgi:putative membrane protein
MKRVTTFLLFTGLCLGACNNGTNKQDSVDSAKDANGQKDTSNMTTNNNRSDTMSTTPVDKDVSDFAVEAASGGLMEVELGKIAQEKATNPRIKDFGAMMVKDHSDANDQLKNLAQQKNITLPADVSDKQRKDIDDLNKKTGKDFDKAYMSMMLDDHKKDIKKFEKAGNDLKDADVKSFAMKTLPTLQKHLDSAKAIAGKH